MNPKTVNKISSKTLGIEPAMVQGKDAAGRPKMLAADTPENRKLFRVSGIASGMKTGVSAFGEWCAFIGTFLATNIQTGEIFRSGKLFLPPLASNLVQGALMAGNTQVEFGYDIGVEPSERSAQGYEWVVESLIDASASDPLETLLGKIKTPLPEVKKDEPKKVEETATTGSGDGADKTSPTEAAPKKNGNGKAK